MITNFLLVALGGGLGSMARYGCQRFFIVQYPGHFPWGTMLVNIAGCFLIGIFWGLHFRSFNSNESWKLFLMTGLCGGFTTFSAFTLEAIGLLREDRAGLFFIYVGGSVLAGLIATWAAIRLMR